tara:strand:+ start:201 stop:434 length:234 start_codon:yes stop_codon:yes gene_type:complete
MKLTSEPALEDLRPEPVPDPVVGDFIITQDGLHLYVEGIAHLNHPGTWYDCTDDDGGDHTVHLSSVVAVIATPTKGY